MAPIPKVTAGAGPSTRHEIRLRGVREGPLDGADLVLPLRRLVCLSGPHGSGLQALAERVLLGESRRRYLLSMSPFERESLGGIGVAATVDEVTGLPPAQRLPLPARPGHTVASRLQLPGDLVRVVRGRAAIRCASCGRPCAAFDEDSVARLLEQRFRSQTCLVVAPLRLGGSPGADAPTAAIVLGVLAELSRAGFRRLLLNGEVTRLEEVGPEAIDGTLQVIVDRLTPGRSRSRVGEAVRSARGIAGGSTLLVGRDGESVWANQRLSCTACGVVCEEPDWEGLLRGAGEGAERITLAGKPIGALAGELPLWRLRELAADATPPARRLRRALGIVADLGLDHLPVWRRVTALSHGEQLLLGVAASLVSGLKGVLHVVLSPPSALDPRAREAVIRGLRQLLAAGGSVVAVDSAPSAGEWADETIELGRPSPSPGTGAQERRAAASAEEDEVQDLVVAAVAASTATAVPARPRLTVAPGRLTILSGPMAAGKTAVLRLLRQALSGSARSRLPRPVRAPAVRRCFDIGAEVEAPAGERVVLLQWLGAGRPLARVLADSPAAQELGLGADAFLLDRPGGRCVACEGRGVVHHRLDVVEDLTETCPRCEGRRFRDEVLQATAHGLTIAETLGMTVAEAEAHFAREHALRAPLAEALRCGLGTLRLGESVDHLERVERVLARLARHVLAARAGDLVLLDRPAAGCTASDSEVVAGALQRLAARGATVVLADGSGRLERAADRVLSLPPRRVERPPAGTPDPGGRAAVSAPS